MQEALGGPCDFPAERCQMRTRVAWEQDSEAAVRLSGRELADAEALGGFRGESAPTAPKASCYR